MRAEIASASANESRLSRPTIRSRSPWRAASVRISADAVGAKSGKLGARMPLLLGKPGARLTGLYISTRRREKARTASGSRLACTARGDRYPDTQSRDQT